MQIKLEVPDFIVRQVLDYSGVADRLRPLVQGKEHEGHIVAMSDWLHREVKKALAAKGRA